MPQSIAIVLAAGGVIPLLMFLGFVGIVLIISAIANAAGQQKKRDALQQRAHQPPPLPPPVAESSRPRTPKSRRRPIAAKAPPLTPAAPEPAPALSVPSAPAQRSSGIHRGATANSLADWLVPHTLRGQYILTEIFQKPLALREEQDRLS